MAREGCPDSLMHLYFLGIGGTLMGNLALLAKSLGHRVSGCDEALYPPMSELLAQGGIEALEGFDARQLEPSPDLVIMGNARCSRGHAGVEAVLERGLRYVSGAEWLGTSLLPGRNTLAVAGTHGKTSGASMLAWILEYANLNPGFLIGGAPQNFDSGARLGDAKWFVLEADEYDCSYFDRRAKFLHYRPKVLVINNLEYDHADIYPNLAAIEDQFHHVLRAVPASGLVITPEGDTALERVLARGCWSPRSTCRVSGFGESTGTHTDRVDARQDTLMERAGTHVERHSEPHWRAELLAPDASAFRVFHLGQPVGAVHWSQCGEHMVANALGAMAAAYHAKIPPATSIKALALYAGVRRRLEIIHDSPEIRVYDDFAHHPTAIRKTLAALKQRALAEDRNAEVIAVIEPRSHTMSLGTLRSQLASATKDATQVYWFKGERVSWDLSYLTRHSPVPSRVETSLDRLVTTLSKLGTLPAGVGKRHLVLMSNGSFGGIQARLTEAIGQQARTRAATSAATAHEPGSGAVS